MEELTLKEVFLRRPYRRVRFREVFEPDINSRVIRFEVQIKRFGRRYVFQVDEDLTVLGLDGMHISRIFFHLRLFYGICQAVIVEPLFRLPAGETRFVLHEDPSLGNAPKHFDLLLEALNALAQNPGSGPPRRRPIGQETSDSKQ